MNRLCRIIRQRAAEQGVDTVACRDLVREHLATCAGCGRALAALQQVDQALATLPPIDAPDETVAALLERVAVASAAEPALGRSSWVLRLRAAGDAMGRLIRLPAARRTVAMAALIVLALTANVLLRRSGTGSSAPGRTAEVRDMAAQAASGAGQAAAPGALDDEVLGDAVPETRTLTSLTAKNDAVAPTDQRQRQKREALARRQRDVRRPLEIIGNQELPETKHKSLPRAAVPERSAPASSQPIVIDGAQAASEKFRLGAEQPAAKAERRDLPAAPSAEEMTISTGSPRVDGPAAAVGSLDTAPRAQAQDAGRFNQGAETSADQIQALRSEVKHLGKKLKELDSLSPSITPAKSTPPPRATAVARAYLAERERTKGLVFQDAHGYWSNTYVPGDPTIRLLQARLAANALAAVGPRAGVPEDTRLRLHQHVQPPDQPFDPPKNAALALYVDADRVAATGPTRTLIQVGLKAADRRAGARPKLSVAVVLDLAYPVAAGDIASMRALLQALARIAEPGDRFQVFFAGRDVEPLAASSLRHGALMVALDDALARPMVAGSMAVRRAIAEADQALLAGGDSILGSRGVLVVSGRLEPETGLAPSAHRSALAGVPLSVVALGNDVDQDAYRRLALAGQGRIRSLRSPQAAAGLLAREIDAVSQVVARALRLNIRLAPGVELVGVLGAERLDVAATARAKAAEQRIDQQVARDLGIRADRGNDDDGIQILIPSFLAGDSHVVLIDVVVPGPGKVADVSLRFKDLLRAKNGMARARLSLAKRVSGRRAAAAARRAHRVRRSLLGWKLSAALGAASGASPAVARARLLAVEALLQGLPELDPLWAGDAEREADLALVRAYQRWFESGAGEAYADGDMARWLADSLRVAGARKLLRIPPVDGR